MLRVLRITFVLVVCLVFLAACGSEDPTGPKMDSPPQVETVSIKEEQQISELTPITVTFNKEMSYVDIQVDGAIGTTTVNGNTAVWTPIPGSESQGLYPGSHSISIMGTDKFGQGLVNPETIRFVAVPDMNQPPAGSFPSNPPPQNPWEIMAKVTAAELWYPGGIGSKWVYSRNGETITSTLSEEIVLRGKTYKVVENAPFLNDPDNPGKLSDPFSVFRQAEPDQILGYVEQDMGEAREVVEEEMNNLLEESGLLDQLGLSENDVHIDCIPSQEWTILGKPMPGNNWVVARTSMVGWLRNQKILEQSQKIQATVTNIIENFSTQTLNDLLTVKIRYEWVETSQGEETDRYLLFFLYLSPDIGIVAYEDREGKTELLEYNIVQ